MRIERFDGVVHRADVESQRGLPRQALLVEHRFAGAVHHRGFHHERIGAQTESWCRLPAAGPSGRRRAGWQSCSRPGRSPSRPHRPPSRRWQASKPGSGRDQVGLHPSVGRERGRTVLIDAAEVGGRAADRDAVVARCRAPRTAGVPLPPPMLPTHTAQCTPRANAAQSTIRSSCRIAAAVGREKIQRQVDHVGALINREADAVANLCRRWESRCRCRVPGR